MYSKIPFPMVFLTMISILLTNPAHAGQDTSSAYLTNNVFIVSIDGIRDLEAFSYNFHEGEVDHPYIPFIWNTLKPQGTAFMEMYNVFHTITSPGHQTILTGDWQIFPNYGLETWPHKTRAWAPTIFEYARKELGLPKSKTWCVVGKLNCVESDYSLHPAYGESYGANLIHEPPDYIMETDSLTVDALMNVLDADHPSLVFVNLQGVDATAHIGSYMDYLQAITLADRAVQRIWDRIDTDPAYQGNTTIIVTTDHGRHDPGLGGPYKSGYSSHGGICHGCQHVMCLVVGPDTPAGLEVQRRAYQIDIAPTVGELYGFHTPYATGQVLREAISGYGAPDRLIRKQPAADVYNGMVFVVWSDNHTGNDEVYMLTSMDNGITFGDTIQVSQSGVGAIQPTVAADESGVHVAWLDFRNDVWSLYHRRSTDFGVTWGGEDYLFSNIPETQERTRALIMWGPRILSESRRMTITVSGHRYSLGGAFSQNGGNTWDLQLLDGDTFFPVNVTPCSQSSNIGMAWCDQSEGWSGEPNWEVFYSSSPFPGGSPRNRSMTPVRLSMNTSYSIQSTIASDGFLNLGIGWADNLTGFFQIFFRNSDDGGSNWYNNQILTASPVGAWQPDLSWDRTTNNIHLVWTDYRDGQGEIYYSRFDGLGWSPEARLTTSTGSVNHPRIAMDENGDSFLVWEVVTDNQISIGMGNLISP